MSSVGAAASRARPPPPDRYVDAQTGDVADGDPIVHPQAAARARARGRSPATLIVWVGIMPLVEGTSALLIVEADIARAVEVDQAIGALDERVAEARADAKESASRWRIVGGSRRAATLSDVMP